MTQAVLSPAALKKAQEIGYRQIAERCKVDLFFLNKYILNCDIEDEFDYDELEDNIIQERHGHWRVKGITAIADLNAMLGSNFSDEEFDTVAGLVINHFGHLPKQGESISFDGYRFLVLRADSRRIHSLQIERLAPTEEDNPD